MVSLYRIFWGFGALEMLLSYMALVACSVRPPEAIIFFVDPGGEGKTLLLCDLMKAVWGTGQFGAPPSIFQIPEGFRRQGRIYMGRQVDIY